MPPEDLWERAIANSYIFDMYKCFDTAIRGLEALRNLSSVFLPHFAYYPVRFVQQSFPYHLLASRTLSDIRRGTLGVADVHSFHTTILNVDRTGIHRR